ncbi:MAG: hypothetical protein A2Z18_02250 [Armatimonadetes bacterium RBG_16_58_9]|nr:MAG: hypothetical protein A2Z18_02250 [Armatimonadetes bacterium RBG_16_58_9]
MSIVVRVHFDGKTIVPDEPVDLPINQPMEAELRIPESRLAADKIKQRLDALSSLEALAVKAANIPLEALQRENLYDSDRGL